ncbi:putative receptor-like protein kinase [Camellia lanceoleosa]|uniref:Receptor-like protein kinase n=1 Tax=Camellia lanceoleosa TaxID=1840588 RepID=A0ACC0FST6_9ERIC|nr:putative receptor-like protein kinase [Camellia lanceoleosa]
MPINNSNNKTQCCQTLLRVYEISLSQHLKETSLFKLPDLPTSLSCLSDFQSKLNSFSLSSDLTSLCFDPLQFFITPNICASIETTHDWVSKLGPSTSLDTACRPDLTDLTSCDACVAAGFRVQNQLIAIDGNKNHSTDCFYLTILYAAGNVNQFGPESIGAMSCIFGLSIGSQSGSSKSHLAMVFGLTGACVVAFVMSVLLCFYCWWHKKWGNNKSDAIGFGLDMEEVESRARMRPNTGSIWFKIDELSMATENFSQKNFIGRGGFGVVYKGTLSDGTVVAVKQVIESDFQGREEFCNEVEIISNLKHRNLVPLRGCCVTGEENGEYEDGESQRYLVYDYMPNGNLDDHLFWSEKQSMAGKIEEVLDSSLLGYGNLANSNPKAIMERFLLVGILCAHVMVALRPTILDAVKMLEGDIEVPAIPDGPMPLGHPSFSRDGNTFGISPVLSGPKLNSGDMLR